MKFTLNQQSVKTACVEHILNIDLAEKPIMTVEILPFKKNRSSQQNRYYFGAVLPLLADNYGDSKNDFHEYLKRKFLMPTVVKVNGFTFEIMPSTAKLSTNDFNEFVEQVCRFASEEMGIFVPPPNYQEF